jgi:hypothetical protein
VPRWHDIRKYDIIVQNLPTISRARKVNLAFSVGEEQMESEELPSLQTQVDTADTGDDTQRRFRYQAAYAAILSLELLNPSSDFDELFCEHHEDILVKKKDASFIGVQVKTRESGRDLFKANDSEIVSALTRFVEQYIQYPNQYSRFVLATNYAFWRVRSNSQNLYYLLNLAQAELLDNPLHTNRALSGYVKRILRNIEAGMQSQASGVIMEVLSKTGLEDRLPKFDDVEMALVRSIPENYQHNGVGFDDLLRTSRTLVNEMFEAASLEHTSPRNSYFSMLSNPTQMAMDVVIEGKRITKEKIHALLTGLLSEETLLTTAAPVSISDLPAGMGVMELKMAKGRVSAINIHRSKDHKYSTERLFNSWMYKYGVEQANARYKQMMVIVANACQEVYDQLLLEGEPFGQKMLIALRERLHIRFASEPNSFFGCKYEHVLGVVAILTELCEVWWSDKFDIPEGVIS